jgi:T4 RnlA family RNA ligase
MIPMHKDFVKLLETRKEIREKKEMIEGEEYTIVSYMISTSDLWDEPLATECRGITFDSEGRCVARTMEKFFNVNENAHTQEKDLDLTDCEIYDKLDGSMISVVRTRHDSLLCKSKKSFTSDVAISAQSFMAKNLSLQGFCDHLIDNGFTPTFEFLSPKHRIVLPVEKESMIVTLARHISTGVYMGYDQLAAICSYYNVPIVQLADVPKNLDELKALAESVSGIEGWVIKLANGQRVKLKTREYLNRHKAASLSERNIFDLVMSEEIDDVVSINTDPRFTEALHRVETKIEKDLQATVKTTEDLVKEWKDSDLDLPTIGKTYSSSPFFPLAIALFKNREPDYKKHLVRTTRDSYSTIAIVFIE